MTHATLHVKRQRKFVDEAYKFISGARLLDIGANYLTSKSPLWFTLADCLASQLLTGKRLKIKSAVIFGPEAAQDNLVPVAIGGDQNYLVDPYKEDFYQRLIEMRQETRQKRDAASGQDREELEIQQNAVKIAANATSYGIFAQINVSDRPNKSGSKVYGISGEFVVDTIKEETGGSGNDFLEGDKKANAIIGGDGNDTLFGGAGADVLIGGSGNDIFQFNSAKDGIDTVEDFVSGGRPN